MAKLFGKWKLDSSDNFDEFLKVLGVSSIIRSAASRAKSRQVIKAEGEEWVLKSKSSIKNTSAKGKLGVPFKETTADGRHVTTTLSVEGDRKLVQEQKGHVDAVITRELIDEDDMRVTCVAAGVTAIRMYKREKD